MEIINAEDVAARVTRLGYFCQLGDFWRLAQRNGNFLGYFFVEENLFNFHLNKQFQNMVYCRYFEVSKVVRCRCFVFSN
jgi:hypothetical protein